MTALVSGAVLLLAACGSSSAATSTASPSPSPVSGTVTLNGSSALDPLVAAAKDGFEAANPNATVQHTPTSSGTGLSQVASGAVNIGMSDFPSSSATGLTNADQLIDHQVAVSAFLIIADPNQTVSNLTKQQVHDIFTGKITNWSGVGGSNQAIVLIGRPASSGTRKGFDKIVMAPDAEAAAMQPQPSGGGVVQLVGSTPGAIGYAGLGDIKPTSTVKKLKYGGVDPTIANVENGSFPLWFHEHMYTLGAATGVAKAFIDYMTSDAFQTGSAMTAAQFAPLSKVKGTSPADQ
ncbi:MAG TPA: phosphate ABC transporter substrate-binding protein [Candidatus Solibacter sp.]|nr:phosphate ABC transporter substrate-binding protein [Candidatus Solibacter sp.]